MRVGNCWNVFRNTEIPTFLTIDNGLSPILENPGLAKPLRGRHLQLLVQLFNKDACKRGKVKKDAFVTFVTRPHGRPELFEVAPASGALPSTKIFQSLQK